MNARRTRYYRTLFLAAAVCDIVLGLVFIFFYRYPFRWLGVPVPYSTGYVTLIGAFPLVIGVAYYLISRGNLRKNRDLIIVGTWYKLVYSTVAFYHLAAGDIPHLLFAVFGAVDVVFFALFAECLHSIRRVSRQTLRESHPGAKTGQTP